MIIQFSQHHLLKSLSSFFPLIILGFPVKYQLTVYVRVYFWALKSVLLVCVSVFVSVPYCFDYYSFVIQFEIRKCDASSFVLLSQNCSGYLGSFMILSEFYGSGCLSISVKSAIEILIGIALNLQIALDSKDILTILILLIHEYGYLSNCVFFNFFHQDLIVFSVQIFHLLG